MVDLGDKPTVKIYIAAGIGTDREDGTVRGYEPVRGFATVYNARQWIEQHERSQKRAPWESIELQWRTAAASDHEHREGTPILTVITSTLVSIKPYIERVGDLLIPRNAGTAKREAFRRDEWVILTMEAEGFRETEEFTAS